MTNLGSPKREMEERFTGHPEIFCNSHGQEAKTNKQTNKTNQTTNPTGNFKAS